VVGRGLQSAASRRARPPAGQQPAPETEAAPSAPPPRPQLEAADWLEGFLLLQSVAGGTGAGLGTYLSEALADEFREGQLVNVCVW
jgi:hypothetical protein